MMLSRYQRANKVAVIVQILSPMDRGRTGPGSGAVEVRHRAGSGMSKGVFDIQIFRPNNSFFSVVLRNQDS